MEKKKVETADEKKTYAVKCCKCNVKLTVKSGCYAYKCPKCGQMFRIRRIERLVKEIDGTEK